MKQRHSLVVVAMISTLCFALYASHKRLLDGASNSRPLKRHRQYTQQEQEKLNAELRKAVNDLAAATGNVTQEYIFVNRVHELMSLGANINASFSDDGQIQRSGTMLHRAVYNLDIDQVRRLIALGADVNARGGMIHKNDYSLPLHALAYATQNDLDNVQTIAQLLIDAGADVNRCGFNHESIFHAEPVMEAYDNGGYLGERYLYAMQSIFGSKQNINCASLGGRTPIMVAAMTQYCLYAYELISLGAHVSLTDNYGNNLLHYLVNGYDSATNDEWDEEAQEQASSYLEDATKLAKKALKQCPALLDQRNIMGETPLFAALARGGDALNIYKLFLQLSSPEDAHRRNRVTTVLGEHCIHLLKKARRTLVNGGDRKELWREAKKEFKQSAVLAPQCQLAKLLGEQEPQWRTWRKREAARRRKEVKSWFIGKLGQAEPERRHFLPAVIVDIILKMVGQFEPELYEAEFSLIPN